MLAWLLDEQYSAVVREMLMGAQTVATSDLTLIECDRVLHRASALGKVTEAAAAERQAALASAARAWSLLHIHGDVIARARGRFGFEPVRSLDAIHLASALVWARIGPVTVLSLDVRVRQNARALGFGIAPNTA